MVLVNGVAGAAIAACDRGFAYGDGVFRTLRMSGEVPVHWDRQYARLQADCHRLSISCPSQSLLAKELALAVTDTPAEAAAKIIISRGEGKRGYSFDSFLAPTRAITAFPLAEHPAHFASDGIRMHLCDLRLGHQPLLAGIKHLNRLENVLARAEWSDPQVAEGLLLDFQGNVIGGTMSNVFMVKNGVLCTPDLSNCGVAGVTRSRVLEFAAANGFDCRTGNFSLDFLLDADEVFVCNSLIGLWRVREIGGRVFTVGDCFSRLSKLS